MHLAVVFEYSSLNGGERSMLAVMNHLRNTPGFQFTAIAPDNGLLAEQLKSLAIPVVPFDCRGHDEIRRPASELLSQLQAICEDIEPDVLHANSLSMARVTGRLRSQSPVATSGKARNVSGTRRQPPLVGGHLRDIVGLSQAAVQDLNGNDFLVAVSTAVKNFHASQGMDSSRCSVICNGVDLQLFTPRDRLTHRALVLPSVPVDATILLTVGQICLRKGQLDIARAILNVVTRTTNHNLHWVVAGDRYSAKPESIAYEQSIATLFQADGFLSNLHQLGFRHDIPQLMNAADVLVHGARQEPFGRVLLEAAASGLPIVATDVGGTREMLCHEQDALLVPPADSAALEQALIRIVQQNGLCGTLAANALQNVRERFAVQDAAEHLARCWQTAVGCR